MMKICIGPCSGDITCVLLLIAGRGLEPISHNGNSDVSHDGYKSDRIDSITQQSQLTIVDEFIDQFQQGRRAQAYGAWHVLPPVVRN